MFFWKKMKAKLSTIQEFDSLDIVEQIMEQEEAARKTEESESTDWLGSCDYSSRDRGGSSGFVRVAFMAIANTDGECDGDGD